MFRTRARRLRWMAVVQRPAVFLIAGALLLVAQPGGLAQTPGPTLQFYKNYFLPGGDYIVGGVGLRGQGQGGFASGSISLSGVPGSADIAAVFLYWVTLEPNDTAPMSENAIFRGQPVSGKEIGPGVRVPGCWGSGGSAGATSPTTQARTYRADILKNFDVSQDPASLGKLLVNGTHTVSIPDSGGGGTQAPSSGNQVNYAEGAAVVVVYRVASAPLRAVVIFDGAATADQDAPMFNLNVGGYYDATATPNARMTHLVADGGLRPETLTVNGLAVAESNPFNSTQGIAWDNPTYNVAGPVSDAGIPTALTFPSSSIDCLSWGAVVASLDVQDTDNDGIPDAVEGSPDPVVEPPSREHPGGLPLPNYYLKGARPTTPDIFVEFAYFKTDGWGPASNVTFHDHRPAAEALEMVAKAFKRAGINAHFDIGDDAADFDNRYPLAKDPWSNECQNLATWSLGCSIVGYDARGGESVTEASCGLAQTCQFFLQKGVVGWKSGYNYFRDAWVDAATGAELTPEAEFQCEQSGGCGRRRFDENRRDFDHFALWAHALGIPKEPNQCLAGSVFDPVDNRCEDSSGGAVPDNPNYHITGTHSGFGDLEGADSLFTLHGFGNNWNGAPITQAGTLLHELSHNLGIRHAGVLAAPNCKPNYISVANYTFQIHGIQMLDASGQPVLGVDLSGQVLSPLNETGLADAPLAVQGGGSPTYPTRWFAPAATSFIHSGLGLTPATKHCNGSPRLPTDPDMVRVDGASASGAIDWLADGDVTDTGLTQDINFNGGPNPVAIPGVPSDAPFAGFNDWLHVKQLGLRQVGGRPNMGLLSLDVFTSDLGRGDPGRGDPGRGDPGRGDPGRGDPGRGDPGRGDPGRGDPGRGDPGAPGGDLDIDTATAHAQAPHRFRAATEAKTVRLAWMPTFVRPEGVDVLSSTVYRVEGTTVTPQNFAKRKLIGHVFGTTTTIVDDKPLNGKPVVYILFEDWTNGTRSGYVTVGFTYR